MIDLGSVHLFCASCKIFQETPSLLRWETASGSKRTAGSNPAWPPLPFRNSNRLGSIGPPQHYEIPSRLGSLGLPQPLEISSRLSGTSALQSRGAFRPLQAHSFAYPSSTKESLAQAQLVTQPCSDTRRGRALSWPSGPKFFPQGWDPERSLRAQDPRGTLEVLPAGVLATGGQGRSPPQGPKQGVAPTPARASTSPLGEAAGAAKWQGPSRKQEEGLRGSSGPPREEDEPPTGTGSFNSLTPFSGSPGSR